MKARFHVCNFNSCVTAFMNEEFAAMLFEFIREQDEIDPVLYAFTEKIENQFYFMRKLTVS